MLPVFGGLVDSLTSFSMSSSVKYLDFNWPETFLNQKLVLDINRIYISTKAFSIKDFLVAPHRGTTQEILVSVSGSIRGHLTNLTCN